ncbi:MAG TPA: DUF4965 domain-containing protein [Fimbriimonas sp.]|nr:DUF4965 domain-containing protein [Fimbriimonas sp.]
MIRLWALAALLAVSGHGLGQSASFRPPAVPLVTSDPYLSIWSEADKATDAVTRHWTHRPHPLVSMVRIDGTAYRLLGNDPVAVPPLPQTGLMVTPTKTSYQFANGQVRLTMSFLTPLLPDDLDVLARPVTYLTWDVASLDGHKHKVELFESTSALIAVNSPEQAVKARSEQFGTLTALSSGTVDQTLLKPAGDDTRIDWGYVYAVADESVATGVVADDASAKAMFTATGQVKGSTEPGHKPAEQSLAFSFDLGLVGTNSVARHMMIGYDEIYSILYFGKKLPPYWRRNGETPSGLFQKAEDQYGSVSARSARFDKELTADATALGGPEYAQILALSYRECMAANGIAADDNKQPLLFTKENTSNGDIATVDVIFPMDPIFVLLSPTLAKASLVSNFAYSASWHWKFPNAPHDLGTYPQVFGRDDGGEGMPVEESGNMIILTDAIAHDENSAEFAAPWWPQLTQWAHYLEQYGLDPEDQLCTDDFMGHLAHNANLSVKAILALAAYGDLCRFRGDKANADKYMKMAKVDAQHWVQVADAGNRSLLAFDQPNTWSQKYNLVWDKILGLNVFPPEVARKEVAFYKTVMQPFGLPLDSRTHLTKTDWTIWSATMAESPEDFRGFISPIYRYLNETTTRDPISDSYMTDDPHSGGMHARPVVGGFFVKLLSDPAIWRKWASRDHMKTGTWAPLPTPPKVDEVVPTGRHGQVTWRYTTHAPPEGWNQPGFNDASWSTGAAAFGTDGTPGITPNTKWDTGDIWLRRSVTLPQANYRKALFLLYHDEDVEVYVDGVLAAKEPEWVTDYEQVDIDPAAQKLLKPGATVTIAIHCHQTSGGQGVDVGIAVPQN